MPKLSTRRSFRNRNQDSIAWIQVPSVAGIALNRCLGWKLPLTPSQV